MHKYEEPLNSADFYFEEVEHLKLKGIGKKVAEKAKGAAKKIGSKIKDAAKNLHPSDALWLPLVPFKLAMKKALKKKGIDAGNKLPKIAEAFAKNIIGKHNLDEEESDQASVKEKTTGEKLQDVAGTVQQVGGVVGSAAGIIKIIIGFFKKNDDKVKSGKASPDEMEMKLDAEDGLSAADNSTSEQLAEAAKGSQSGTTKDKTTTTMGVDNKTLYLLAGIVVVVLILRKK